MRNIKKSELLIDFKAIIDLKLQLKCSAFRFTFFFKQTWDTSVAAQHTTLSQPALMSETEMYIT